MALSVGAAVPTQPSDRDDAIAGATDLSGTVVATIEKDVDADGKDGGDLAGEQPHHKHQQSPKAKKHTKKRVRVRNRRGTNPVAKRILDEPDSDDQRIIKLKLQGYSNEFVAARFRAEDRIRYEAKTIASRWVKLREIVERKEDERLDDELTDWHEEEDGILNDRVAKAEEKYQRELKRLEDKKWKDVSLAVAAGMEKKKFTAKACRERFDGLQDGTALLPIEQDPDQAGRRQLCEERIVANRAARAAAKESFNAKEGARTSRVLAREKALAELNQKKIEAVQAREAAKREAGRIKKERRVLAKRTRLAKQAVMDKMRAQLDWKRVQNRKERALYKALTGRPLGGRRHGAADDKGTDDFSVSDDESNAVDQFESDEEEQAGDEEDSEQSEQDVVAGAEDEDERDDVASPAYASSTRRGSTVARGSGKSKHKSTKQAARPKRNSTTTFGKETGVLAPTPTSPAAGKTPVTADTLANARSVLSLQELTTVCAERNLPRPDIAHERHHDIVARLMTADQTLADDELETLLSAKMLPTHGNRGSRIRRLQEADAAESKNGRLGVKSTQLAFMRHYTGYAGEFKDLLTAAEVEAGVPLSSMRRASQNQQIGGRGGDDSDYESDEITVSHVMRR